MGEKRLIEMARRDWSRKEGKTGKGDPFVEYCRGGESFILGDRECYVCQKPGARSRNPWFLFHLRGAGVATVDSFKSKALCVRRMRGEIK